MKCKNYIKRWKVVVLRVDEYKGRLPKIARMLLREAHVTVANFLPAVTRLPLQTFGKADFWYENVSSNLAATQDSSQKMHHMCWSVNLIATRRKRRERPYASFPENPKILLAFRDFSKGFLMCSELVSAVPIMFAPCVVLPVISSLAFPSWTV